MQVSWRKDRFIILFRALELSPRIWRDKFDIYRTISLQNDAYMLLKIAYNDWLKTFYRNYQIRFYNNACIYGMWDSVNQNHYLSTMKALLSLKHHKCL